MDLKAEIKNIAPLYEERKLLVSITCPMDHFEGLQKLLEKKVRIKLTRWRAQRSLDANAYYWKLVNEISKATGQPSTNIHNTLLADYGVIDANTGMVWLDFEVNWEELPIHLKPTGNTQYINETLMCEYVVIKGSSLYDSKEMSNLIEGAVSEAKELGIDTLNSKRLEEMIRGYEQEHPARA